MREPCEKEKRVLLDQKGKIKAQPYNNKYNACRSFIFIENEFVNLKIRNTKTLIE